MFQKSFLRTAYDLIKPNSTIIQQQKLRNGYPLLFSFVAKTIMCKSVFPEIFRELKEKEDTVLLDVRSPRERYEEGFIPGHQLMNFENPQFSYQLDELDKEQTYLVYCRSGNRSKQACELMRQKGFDNVINLEGGIKRWKATFTR